MTVQERKLANELSGFESVELHKNISVNGKRYWKVKHNGSAMMQLTFSMVEGMERKGWVTGSHSLKELNALALRAAALDWQARKDKRVNRKPRKTKNDEIF